MLIWRRLRFLSFPLCRSILSFFGGSFLFFFFSGSALVPPLPPLSSSTIRLAPKARRGMDVRSSAGERRKRERKNTAPVGDKGGKEFTKSDTYRRHFWKLETLFTSQSCSRDFCRIPHHHLQIITHPRGRFVPPLIDNPFISITREEE